MLYWDARAGAAVRARVLSVDAGESPLTYEVALRGAAAPRHTEATRLAPMPAGAREDAAAAAAPRQPVPGAVATAGAPGAAAGGSTLLAELAAARHARRGRPA